MKTKLGKGFDVRLPSGTASRLGNPFGIGGKLP